MNLHLKSPAIDADWIREDQCLLVLQDGDIWYYRVHLWKPLAKGRSLWRYEAVDDDPTAFAATKGAAMVAYRSWLFPISASRIGGEVDLGEIIWTMAYSTNGRYLAVGTHLGTVAILDARTLHTLLWYANRHDNGVSALSWAPGTSQIASGDTGGRISSWDPWTGRAFFAKRVAGEIITHLNWAGPSSLIYAGDDRQIGQFINGKRGWQQQIEGLSAFAYAPGQRVVAAGDSQGVVHLWRPDDPSFGRRALREHQVLDRKGRVQTSSPVTCLSFSPSGRQLLSCALDGSARIIALDLLPQHR